MSAGTGGSEADPASCWVGLSLHDFAGLTSSLDAEQTVAVLALCDCSPEPHEPGSDRVVPGKVLLSAEPGLGPNLRSNGGSPGTGCTTGVHHGVVPVPKESVLGNSDLSMQTHFHLQFQGCYLPIAPPRVRRT